VAVPNNDSYLGWDFNNLNVPPHHMGLWNRESLMNIRKYFSVRMKQISYEPQNGAGEYYQRVARKRLQKTIGISLPGRVIRYSAKMLPKKYTGFSLVAVYEKI
jgi:hypothetical protein